MAGRRGYFTVDYPEYSEEIYAKCRIDWSTENIGGNDYILNINVDGVYYRDDDYGIITYKLYFNEEIIINEKTTDKAHGVTFEHSFEITANIDGIWNGSFYVEILNCGIPLNFSHNGELEVGDPNYAVIYYKNDGSGEVYDSYDGYDGNTTHHIISSTLTHPSNSTVTENFIITGNANGGDSDVSITAIKTIENTYNFLGWSESASSNVATYTFGDSIIPTGIISLYAVWKYESSASYDNNTIANLPIPTKKSEGDGYTVTLDADGGNLSTNVLTTGTATSYSFKGWASNSAGSVLPNNTSYTSDATVYAIWEATHSGDDTVTLPVPTKEDSISYYSVNFDVQGGNSISPEKAPVTTSYTFKGWSTNGSNVDVSSPYTPSEDITLYAIWESSTTVGSVILPEPTRDPDVTKYNISLDTNGGNLDTTQLYTTQTITYTFKTWATSKLTSTAVSSPYTPESNLTILIAIWQQKITTTSVELPTPTKSDLNETFDIKLYPGDGTVNPSSLSSTNTTKYTFDGWSTTEDSSGIVSNPDKYTTTSSYTTLHAIWTSNKSYGTVSIPDATRESDDGGYTITLNATGGSCSPSSFTVGSTESYTFDGWSTDGTSGKIISNSKNYTTEQNVNLYAVWSTYESADNISLPEATRDPDENYHIITLNPSGGICTPTEMNCGILTTYIFDGWSTDGTKDNIVSNPDKYTANEDTTLYAIWTSTDKEVTANLPTPTRDNDSNSYTITLDPNGGTCSESELEASIITEYEFDGWSTNGSSNGIVSNPTAYTSPVDITLYAVWLSDTTTNSVSIPDANKESDDDGSYTVILNPDGGTINGSTTLIAKKYINHTFMGWSTSDNQNNIISNSSNYIPTGDITLYAVWDSYKSTNSVLLPDPYKKDYTFYGWSTKQGSEDYVSKNYTPTSDINLYANYKCVFNGKMYIWYDGKWNLCKAALYSGSNFNESI